MKSIQKVIDMQVNNVSLEQLIAIVKTQEPVLGDKSLKIIDICHKVMTGQNLSHGAETKLLGARNFVKSVIKAEVGDGIEYKIFIEKKLENRYCLDKYIGAKVIYNAAQFREVGKLKYLFYMVIGNIENIRAHRKLYVFINENKELIITNSYGLDNISYDLQNDIRCYGNNKRIYCISNLDKNKWIFSENAEEIYEISTANASSRGYISIQH